MNLYQNGTFFCDYPVLCIKMRHSFAKGEGERRGNIKGDEGSEVGFRGLPIYHLLNFSRSGNIYAGGLLGCYGRWLQSCHTKIESAP
jgi:hypothetical protein